MGHLISRYKAVILAAAVLAVATPATAQVPDLKPMNYTLKYDVTWSGLRIGSIFIDSTQNEFRYQVSIDTKTRGIARLFDSTKSQIKAEGRVDEKKLIAQHYSSRSADDDSVKLTTIRYGMKGDILKRERNPADDPASRPPVPIEEANEGLDPVTAMLTLRKKLRDNMEANQRSTTVRSYDGARLADFTFIVHSRTSLEVIGKRVNVINTELKRQPVAGYKAKELKKFKEGDPVITVYFSADERLLPVEADIATRFGSINARLVRLIEKK